MVRLLSLVARARTTIRFRIWTARTRIALSRAGCSLEIVAASVPTFASPPRVEPTLQRLGKTTPGRGSLRLEFGPRVHLGEHLTIEVLPSAHNVLELGEGTTCGSTDRFILFGGEVRIGPFSRIRDVVTCKSSGQLRCGSHTILQSMSMLHCARHLSLEDRVTLGERVSILDSDHQPDGSDAYTQEQPLAVEDVHVGRNAWIGANAVLLRGTRIGSNAVVAAGSVVRAGEYPAGWLVAGAPATARRPLAAVADPTVRRS